MGSWYSDGPHLAVSILARQPVSWELPGRANTDLPIQQGSANKVCHIKSRATASLADDALLVQGNKCAAILGSL